MRMKVSMFRIVKPALFLATAFIFLSCEKILEQKPPDTGSNVLPEDAIQSSEDLQELLNSAYDVLGNTYNGGVQNLFTLTTDNLARPNNHDDYTSVWLRSSTIFNGTISQVFRDLYIAILRTNTVLENLDNFSDLASETRTRMEAEAKFIRALCHFDAVRGWAQPYGYTPSNNHYGVAIRTNSAIENAERATVAAVYAQVLSDLAFARENLPPQNDVYANQWAALALEAEVRFQMHDYQAAYDLANQVLTMSPYSFDDQVNKYQFPDASPEAIFYIFSATRDDGTIDSRNGTFRSNYYAGGSRPTLSTTEEFYDLVTEDAGAESLRDSLYAQGDQDGNVYYYTKMFDEEYFNVPILTITQMKLIRAEAAAELNINSSQAIDDINDIRERAYGNNMNNLIGAATTETIIDAARLERRLEFPFNGQRLHDIKRIGSQGEEIIVRGLSWDCPGMLLQFPSTEQTDLFPLNPRGGC